jgi:hypothetical protein
MGVIRLRTGVAAGLAFASLAAAASAPAGSTAEPASLEAPAAEGILGGGLGDILGVGPGLTAGDPEEPRDQAPRRPQQRISLATDVDERGRVLGWIL